MATVEICALTMAHKPDGFLVVGSAESVAKTLNRDDSRRFALVQVAVIEARPDEKGNVHGRSPRVLVGREPRWINLDFLPEISEAHYSPIDTEEETDGR